MEERNSVIVLSDIHMGTDAPTVWYRREIHETYLMAVLDYIIALADQIFEVILLGDIFEFWSYPPNQLPPSIDDIIATHPNILGSEGKLLQALSALKGRMIFIPGDHDMNMTKADLNKLKSKDGYVIKYFYGAYTPIYDNKIQFMHGHECSVLNAPYFVSHLSPLPIGYFVSRAMSHKIQNILNKTPNKTIHDLEEYSAYSYNDYMPKLPFFYEYFQEDLDVVSNLIDVLMQVSELSGDEPILINQFQSITLNEVKKIYQSKGIMGHQMNRRDIIDYYNDVFAKDNVLSRCLRRCVDTIITAHTHTATIVRKNFTHINTGYMCPSLLQLEQNPVTFLQYEIKEKKYELLSVCGEKPFQITPIRTQSKNDKRIKYNKKVDAFGIKLEEQNPPASSMFTFGWSVFDASLEYWQAMQSGVLSKADELGITILSNDEKSSSIEMITGSLDLISKGINALVIAPFNPELMPVIVENAEKYNVPVVAIDTGTGDARVDAFIVSDNFGGGVLAGEYALDLIKKYNVKSKNFAIIKVQRTAKYALLRGEGFKGVLNEAGYVLIAQVTANSVEQEAYVEMKKILNEYKDNLAIVFCENGTMALGAARAINEAGMKGKILIIGFDAGPLVLEAIKRKDLQGTIAQQPFKMGQIGVETANAILLGEPVSFDDWQQKIILMEVFLVNEKGEFSKGVI